MKAFLSLLVFCLVAVIGVQSVRSNSKRSQLTISEIIRRSQNKSLITSDRIGGEENLEGCSCQNDTCGCCYHLEVERIKLNDTACVNISYLPKEIGIEVAFILDGEILFKREISAKNPPPICAAIPYLKQLASLCLRLYNLDFSSKVFSGCAKVEVKLEGFIIKELDLGCFRFPLGVTDKKDGRYSIRSVEFFEIIDVL